MNYKLLLIGFLICILTFAMINIIGFTSLSKPSHESASPTNITVEIEKEKLSDRPKRIRVWPFVEIER